jgi:Asp-tRNA(Asn)/Glu-tRNA(Gln) amidotransferase A subunit family amidase
MQVECAAYHQEMFARGKDEYRPYVTKMIEDGLSTPAAVYARALEAQRKQRKELASLLDGVDALLTPGAPGAAPRDLSITGSAVMQQPWTTVGFPAISLPTGLGEEGLPLAIQLVGAPLAENHLTTVARWCERALGVQLQAPS